MSLYLIALLQPNSGSNLCWDKVAIPVVVSAVIVAIVVAAAVAVVVAAVFDVAAAAVLMTKLYFI